MPVTWSMDAAIDAPPDALFAWMSDFRADDHSRPAFLEGAGVPREEWPKRTSSRAVVSRHGNVVRLEDAWGRNRAKMVVTIDAPARTLRLKGAFGYEATWRAIPASGGGARISVEGSMRGIFALLFARGIRKQMTDDFNGHVNDARVSLTTPS